MSDINNSIRILFIIISIDKVNNIKIYLKNTHFIANIYDITWIFIEIGYIFVCVQSSKKYFNQFTCNKTNQEQILMQLDNHQQLYHTLIRNISYRKRITRNHSVTHFWSFILIRDIKNARKDLLKVSLSLINISWVVTSSLENYTSKNTRQHETTRYKTSTNEATWQNTSTTHTRQHEYIGNLGSKNRALLRTFCY